MTYHIQAGFQFDGSRPLIYNPKLADFLRRRTLLLDGAMSTMIRHILVQKPMPEIPHTEKCDILNIKAPHIISQIHRTYLQAGADIITTNTFNASVLTQNTFDSRHLSLRICQAGAAIARNEADRMTQITPHRPRFVAGSIGPGITSCKVSTISETLKSQAEALIDGGVDMLLIETLYNATISETAFIGVAQALECKQKNIPVAISFTIDTQTGNLPSGHTVTEVLDNLHGLKPIAVGLNCSYGPTSIVSHMQCLASTLPYHTILYPNAGLPDTSGQYSCDARQFASALMPLIRTGSLNIVGGCCGTTPAHIAALSEAIGQMVVSPRCPHAGETAFP